MYLAMCWIPRGAEVFVYHLEEQLNIQSLLVEMLIASFFAVACFRSRANTVDWKGLAPKRVFVLTSRLERLRRSRWQWCSIVMLLVIVRLRQGTPLLAELTSLAMFILFLSLPASKAAQEALKGYEGDFRGRRIS